MAAATLTFPSQTLLKNVVDPVDGTDAATKTYVDGKTGSGSVAAAGSNTQIQYNNAGNIGASANLTFDFNGNILTITGNLVSNNANLGNLVNANFYTGDGGLLSNIKAAGGSANTVSASSQPNITSVGNLLNLTIGNTTPNVYIDGSGNVNVGGTLNVAGNANFVTLLVGNTASNVYINNAGDLTTGGNVTVTGNLTVLGITTTVNNETIQQSETVTGNLNVSGLSNLANVIITSLTSTRVPFVGSNKQLQDSSTLVWDNPNQVLKVGAGGTEIGGDAGYGYVSATKVIPTNLTDTRLVFSDSTHRLVDSANLTFNSTSNTLSATLFTGTLTTANQPNITSVGTLTSLAITGNLTSGNANLGNLVTANFFSGNSSLLYSINGANITGQVGNATVAGTVYTNAQPNITSVGTLTSLTVSGDISGQSNLSVSNNITTTKLTVTGKTILQGNVEAQSNVTITSNTDSINSSTGALILTLGGLGVYGNIHSGMDVSGTTLTGPLTTANQSNITTIGTLTGLVMAGDITSSGASPAPSLSGFSSVSAVNLTGTLTTANQPNVTSVGTLTSLNVNGRANTVTLLVGNTASNVSIDNKGDITAAGNIDTAGNITIGDGTGGTITGANAVFANYFIGDGSQLTGVAVHFNTGNANYANYSGTVINASQTNITSVGTLTSLTVSGTTNLGYISIDSNGNISNANVISANTLAASNAITRNGRTVATYVSSTTMPTNPQVGDEWYDQTLHKIYQYIYDGSSYNWIDVSAGYIVANVQVQGGTLPVRDSNGNIYANTFVGNALSINNLSITGTTSIGSMVSAGTGKPVSNSTDTLIDIFPKTLYRSAKYIISARNDDGFEVAEMLIIHDDTISFIQTYGDVSTGTVLDIVTFSSNVVGANVCLYATGSNSNTFVNLVSTYVTD
jgi:hypothetical protein